jgi:lysophospholipase L1-like esterase
MSAAGGRLRGPAGIALLLCVNVALVAAVETLSGLWLARLRADIEPTRAGAFVHDPELLWRPEDLFERLERERTRRRGRVILNLGDSVTMGLDVPPGRDYSSLLETCLGGAEGRATVVNLGVEGYSSLQTARLLETVAPALAPEAVTVLVGWNDHWDHGRVPDREVDPTATRIRRWVSLTNTGRLLDRLLLERARQRARWVRRVPLPDFRENLGRMEAYCRTRGIRLLLVLPVYFAAGAGAEVRAVHEDYVRAMRDAGAQRGIEVVDRMEAFVERAELFTPDPSQPGGVDYIHPNAEGHARLAQALCEAMEPR